MVAAGARARLQPVNNAARQLGPRGPREKVARIKTGKGLCAPVRPAVKRPELPISAPDTNAPKESQSSDFKT